MLGAKLGTAVQLQVVTKMANGQELKDGKACLELTELHRLAAYQTLEQTNDACAATWPLQELSRCIQTAPFCKTRQRTQGPLPDQQVVVSHTSHNH